MQAKTLSELARHVGGTVVGDANTLIQSASTLARAAEGQISFLANEKYEKQLLSTRASAVIVKQACDAPIPQLVAPDPYYAFMQIVVLLHGHRQHKKIGISKKASLADSARIGNDCDIYDFAVISENAKIGDNCKVYPGAFVGEDVSIGNDCIIYPNVVIYDGCKIGNRVIINANTAVGEDGFGYATHDGKHHKIPQIGVVVLEDDVELGTCCSIERGTLGDTVISEGTKIGDQVTIGHGTKIGPHCLLVAQVGIAGSATLGHHCVLGGQVGVVGHITVGDNVTVAAQSGVINRIPDGQTVAGAPAIEVHQARRAYSMIQYLPEMRQTLKRHQKQLDRLAEPPKGMVPEDPEPTNG
jgi:UDP-3-O-[3-hydroxymyristoyl] glucosamine N-acyltransferase